MIAGSLRGLISTGHPARHAMKIAPTHPAMTPNRPPTNASAAALNYELHLDITSVCTDGHAQSNFLSMCSVTDTSMTLMILMPPTIKETEATEISR